MRGRCPSNNLPRRAYDDLRVKVSNSGPLPHYNRTQATLVIIHCSSLLRYFPSPPRHLSHKCHQPTHDRRLLLTCMEFDSRDPAFSVQLLPPNAINLHLPDSTPSSHRAHASLHIYDRLVVYSSSTHTSFEYKPSTFNFALHFVTVSTFVGKFLKFGSKCSPTIA